jgi:precorrin-6Y C5,15-methyltransferase (decarboxylating)
MSAEGGAPVAIVGLLGDEYFGRAADAALRSADVVLGVGRLLDVLPADVGAKRIELAGPLAETLEVAAERRALGERVCLLASGDPGFFGIVRVASARFGAEALEIHPAPSSVAVAFARAGVHWDDAAVVSAHGRPLAAAVEAVLPLSKVAVLTAPDQPPEALGRALLEAGCGPRRVTVCARLGHDDETITKTDLQGLAAASFPSLAVVLLEAAGRLDGAAAAGAAAACPTAAGRSAADGPTLAWGLPDHRYAHRAGMITKAEVRAVALGKLALPGAGVLWDVGAGSGSVAIECSRLAPGLRVFAVERRTDDVARLRENTIETGVVVVEGEAPDVLRDLPDPDRVFLGGGGLDVLESVLDRLRPGGVVVATYAALERAAAAATRLGSMVQVAVNRGVPLGGSGALRLAAENPVFICWGPTAAGAPRPSTGEPATP